MTGEEALDWLRQVRGHLYRNRRHPSGAETWVAVVRTPRAGARRGKLIIALGSSLEEATEAAEAQWRTLWELHGAVH